MNKKISHALLLVVMIVSAEAQAQRFLQMFGPPVQEVSREAEANARIWQSADVSGATNKTMGMALGEGYFRCSLPMTERPGDWYYAVGIGHERWDVDLPVPSGDGVDVPDSLWDFGLSTGARFYRGRGEYIGVNLAVESAADKPFNSLDEIGVDATAIYRRPRGNSADAWLFMLNYSRTRSFLENIPLPGFGYWHQPSPARLAFIGIPFLMLRQRFADAVDLQVTYIIPRYGSLELAYPMNDMFVPYLNFSSSTRDYRRADRSNNDWWLSVYEMDLSAGLNMNLSQRWSANLGVGYAFNRTLFEEESYDDRGDQAYDLEDTLDVRIGCSYAW